MISKLFLKNTIMLHGILLAAFALVICIGPNALGGQKAFTVTGIGGAGGIFTPSVSPYDPKLMFCSSDMSGCYRSTDGGKTWTMLSYRQIRQGCFAYPFYVSDDVILWASHSTLMLSRDKGITWKTAGASRPWGGGPIDEIAGIALEPKGQVNLNTLILFVGTREGLWHSDDGGKTWQRCVPESGCTAILPLGDYVYAAVGNKFYVSGDRGRTWTLRRIDELRGNYFTCLTAAIGEDGETVFFGTVDKVGTVKSVDAGKTWKVVQSFDNQNLVVMSANQIEVAYVAQSARRKAEKVWKTADGGETWDLCFHMKQGPKQNVELSWVQKDIHWSYILTRNGIAVDPNNPKTVLLTTQGELYISHDGAKTWKQRVNAEVEPGRYRSTGLEVTTNWKYLFDPFDNERTYIAYTDMGFARSMDRGKTWMHATRGCPWENTFYEVVFDPYVKGRMYAACSGRHDIPYWVSIGSDMGSTGGVCISDDHAVTWRVLGKGLPNAPCMSIAMDPKSPKGNLTLYVAVFGHGVYKSIDNGRTWEKKSRGFGNSGNMYAFMVRVHPKTGDVFASITGRRHGAKFPVPGGLWKTTDSGENWRNLTAKLDLRWPCGFAVHPDDPDVIYLTASTAPGFGQGGVYKTTDGGKSWKHVADGKDFAADTIDPGFVHANFVVLHPDNPGYVYVGTNTHGLWMSPDAGRTWKPFMDFPFGAVAAVNFDPMDRTIMCVATHGGGVWIGPYLP